MGLINLTPAQLRTAANLKEQIESLHKQLVLILPMGGSGSGMPSPFKTAKPAKRKISAAQIAKIRAAQKLRWARVKAAKSVPVAKPAPRRKISAAGIARIRAAQKARWAKIKAAKK
jgi:hypothetical protein